MEWINVKNLLPQDDQNVLMCNIKLGGLPSTGWYEKDVGFSAHGCFHNVIAEITHWMPLPELPKSEGYTPYPGG